MTALKITKFEIANLQSDLQYLAEIVRLDPDHVETQLRFLTDRLGSVLDGGDFFDRTESYRLSEELQLEAGQ